MPTINPSDDPALSGPNDTTDDSNRTNDDPAANNYQNLFHDSNERAEDVNPMQLDVAGHDDRTIGGVINGYVAGEAVPPLPPPLDDPSNNNGGGEVVLIPNTVDHHGTGADNLGEQQQREEAIVVEGEIIGPMPQLQLQQGDGGQLQAGVPVETVQLWEEVAYGLEKNQTGKFLFRLMYFFLMLFAGL